MKTGEVYYRDEQGLWLCESFLDVQTGVVTSTQTLVEENNASLY